MHADVDKTVLYYGVEDGSKLGAHFTFNYQLVEKIGSSSTARDLVDAVNVWVDYLPVQYTPNWVVSKRKNIEIFKITSEFIARRSQSSSSCDTSWKK